MLKTGRLGRRLWYFRTLESTNRYVRDMSGSRLSNGLVCLADYQSAGIGQYGRIWHGSSGENLTFTIVIKPQKNNFLQLFPLAVMYALRETITKLFSLECYIKWPNDLLLSGRKVAGLLTESRYNGKNLDRVYLGLGLNVNETHFPENLNKQATSIINHNGGHPVDRAVLLAELLNIIEPCLDRAEDGDRELIRNINRGILGYGKWVSMVVDRMREETPAKILGINEFGLLTVLTGNYDVKTFTHEQVRIDASPGGPGDVNDI